MTAILLRSAKPVALAGVFAPEEDPRREVLAGSVLGGAVIALLLAAGLVIPLDAAVVAPGVVKVSGERKKVQASDDGVVQTLLVREGQQVKAGQVLMQLSTDDARSRERSMASRAIGLEAEIARLEAEQLGTAAVAVPTDFAALTGEDRVLADRALAMETAQLVALRGSLASQRAILRQRIGQIGEQERGAGVRRNSVERQRGLIDQELSGVAALAAKGYASRTRLLALQRADEDLAGTVGQMDTERARLRASAGEAQLQIEQQRADRLRAAAERLSAARTELATLMPQWTAAREALARTALRAPVTGAVVGLATHTIGGFVPRGATLMEVVPSDPSLEVEAQLDIREGNSVAVGDAALLRLPALHGRNVPEVRGTVSSISADSLTDERTGRTYYSMTVRVPPAEIAHLARATAMAVPLRPGNPVGISLAVRSRSALGYLLEPLTQSLGGAMHEQ